MAKRTMPPSEDSTRNNSTPPRTNPSTTTTRRTTPRATNVNITLTVPLGGHEAGTSITVTPGVAQFLTEQGHAYT